MLDNALNNQHVEGAQGNEFGKRYLVCEGEDITKGEDIPSTLVELPGIEVRFWCVEISF